MIRLLVISPEQTVADVQAASVSLPGVVSPFVVLKDHAPLITSLDPGQIRWTGTDGTPGAVSIASGFVEVRNNTVSAYVEL